MNFFHHKGLGNHLLQLCPKVVKHPVYHRKLHSARPSLEHSYSFRWSWNVLCL